jgi:hypothetical protein
MHAGCYTCPPYTVAVCDLAVERLGAGCVAGRWMSCRWHTAQGTRNVLRYVDITARLLSRTVDVVPLTMQALTVAESHVTLQDAHFGRLQGFVLERPDRPRGSPSPTLNG